METFGEKYRQKAQSLEDKIDKNKLDEIVKAAKDKINEEQTSYTYLDYKNEELSFVIPKLTETQLAYIAKQLDMYVTQNDDNSIEITCNRRPEWSEYLNVGTKIMFLVGPQIVTTAIIAIIGLALGNAYNKLAYLSGLFILFVGVTCGIWLAYSNNRFVRKSIDSQINNEILNKQE